MTWDLTLTRTGFVQRRDNLGDKYISAVNKTNVLYIMRVDGCGSWAKIPCRRVASDLLEHTCYVGEPVHTSCLLEFSIRMPVVYIGHNHLAQKYIIRETRVFSTYLPCLRTPHSESRKSQP